jgi:3,4-dihydroxy-2-butanone 4-phosphate synthase
MDVRLQELRRKLDAIMQANKEGRGEEGGIVVSAERVTTLREELAALQARRAILAVTLARVTKALQIPAETEVEIVTDENDVMRPHKCPKCAKTFTVKASVVRHLGTVHAQK